MGFLKYITDLLSGFFNGFAGLFTGDKTASEPAPPPATNSPASGAPADTAVTRPTPVAPTEERKAQLAAFAEASLHLDFSNLTPDRNKPLDAAFVENTRLNESARNNLSPMIGTAFRPLVVPNESGRLVFDLPQDSRVVFRPSEHSAAMLATMPGQAVLLPENGKGPMVKMVIQSKYKDKTGNYAFAEKPFWIARSALENGEIIFNVPKDGKNGETVDFMAKKGAFRSGTALIINAAEGATPQNHGVDMFMNGGDNFLAAMPTYKKPITSDKDAKIIAANDEYVVERDAGNRARAEAYARTAALVQARREQGLEYTPSQERSSRPVVSAVDIDPFPGLSSRPRGIPLSRLTTGYRRGNGPGTW
jgi:hypothetical protein